MGVHIGKIEGLAKNFQRYDLPKPLNIILFLDIVMRSVTEFLSPQLLGMTNWRGKELPNPRAVDFYCDWPSAVWSVSLDNRIWLRNGEAISLSNKRKTMQVSLKILKLIIRTNHYHDYSFSDRAPIADI